MSSLQVPVELDWSPFHEEELYQLGERKNWHHLRRILRPITNPQFAVTDAVSQAFVDAARGKLESARASADSSDCPYVIKLAVLHCQQPNADVEVIQELLACGVDPDIPDSKGWRPSHICGNLGRFEAAQAIFLCRPDMEAKDENGKTPLKAAGISYPGDDETPEEAVLRTFVFNFIKNGNFESMFPSIAELAVQAKWFAVKNLLRRRVVPQEEFARKFHGKTAAEWADYYKEELMAKEIRYYEQPIALRFDAAASRLLEVSRKLQELEEKVSKIQEEGAEKDQKISDLSETVKALTARLEG